MANLRLALPSEGALYEPTGDFLRDCGLGVSRASSRRYTATFPSLPGVDVLFQRSSDIAGEICAMITQTLTLPKKYSSVSTAGLQGCPAHEQCRSK